MHMGNRKVLLLDGGGGGGDDGIESDDVLAVPMVEQRVRRFTIASRPRKSALIVSRLDFALQHVIGSHTCSVQLKA
jgi:hypothetical protein